MDNSIIDINFKEKTIKIVSKLVFDPTNYSEAELTEANKNEGNGIGKYFPKMPSIKTSLTINNTLFTDINLIIDTGCHYNVVILAKDSSIIKPLLSKKRK